MAVEILDQVFLPTDFAGRSFEANEVTFEAEQKEHVAVYGGRRARPAAILRRNLRCVGEFGKRRSPNLLACAYVDAKDKFSIGVRIGAGAVEPIADDCGAGIAEPGLFKCPKQLRPAGRK